MALTVNREYYVNQAAKKYGVPLWVLNGVWGMETSWGQNVTTSSAGAIGNFQFLPSTARGSYAGGIAGGNRPNDAQFAQQADAAAHYLSDLFKQHGGSWDAALHAYSGGGYGQSQVQAKAKQTPASLHPSQDPGTGAAGAFNAIPGVGDAGSALNSLGGIVSFLTDPKTWIRFGEMLLGGLLLVMGLRSLTGSTTTPLGVAKSVGKKAAAVVA